MLSHFLAYPLHLRCNKGVSTYSEGRISFAPTQSEGKRSIIPCRAKHLVNSLYLSCAKLRLASRRNGIAKQSIAQEYWNQSSVGGKELPTALQLLSLGLAYSLLLTSSSFESFGRNCTSSLQSAALHWIRRKKM